MDLGSVSAQQLPILQISILGPLRVFAAHHDITPSSPQLRKVLALLALRSGRVVQQDEFEVELWGGTPPRSSVTAIQTYVMHLRKLISTNVDMSRKDVALEILVRHATGYSLRLERCRVDIHRYEELATRGRALLAENKTAEGARLLRDALRLWAGEPLSDIEAGQPLQLEVARLNTARAVTRELRINADLRLGRHHELISELTRLVAADFYNETLQAQCLVAMCRSGRRVHALEAYQRFRQALVTDYGLEPSHLLRDLHTAVLQDTPIATDPQHDHPALAGIPKQAGGNLARVGAR